MKRALLINDLSGIGSCSLYADLSVLSAMGIKSVPVLTAALTRQTDYDTYTEVREPIPFSAYKNDYQAANERFDGILTGYAGSPEMLDKTLRLVREFHTDSTCLLVDPVMGDHGRGYDLMSEEYLAGVKSLMEEADLSTPNLTEFCMLTDSSFDELSRKDPEKLTEEIMQLWLCLQRRKNSRMIVTGVLTEDHVLNILLEDSGPKTFASHHLPQDFSGTGDLFASVILGSVLRGDPIESAVTLAQNFLFSAVHRSIALGLTSREGTAFEQDLARLIPQK